MNPETHRAMEHATDSKLITSTRDRQEPRKVYDILADIKRLDAEMGAAIDRLSELLA